MSLRQRQKEETRKRILEEAASLFLKNDYMSVSVEDIAMKVGSSKGAIFYHFSSKEELAVEAVKWFITKKLVNDLDQKESQTSNHVLRNFISESLQMNKEYPGMLNFLLQIMTRGKQVKYINILQDMLQPMFQKVSQKFEREGTKNPGLKTLLLFAVMDGLSFYLILQDQLEQTLFGIDTQLDALTNEIMELFLNK